MDITNFIDWLWLLLGIGIAFTLRVPEHTKVKIPNRTLDWIFISFTLLFVLWSASYTTNIAAITAEGKVMNDMDVQRLFQYADFFRIASLVVLGFIIGLVLFSIIQSHRNQKVNQSKEIKDVLDKIKEYRETKRELDQFFNDISKDKG